MLRSRIQSWFPHATLPIISNAPMIGAACPAMAVEVSKAGGLGFNASTADISKGSAHLAKLQADLVECRERIGNDLPTTPRLPVGVGFVTGHSSIKSFEETALPIVDEHCPAAVWLFAPEGAVKPHRAIIRALKSLNVPSKVFVQVGNITFAREAVEDGADVIVCQGIDAGGHQFRRGMGVVSLVPGVKRMLEEEFPDRDIALIGAGGIASGDSVAAVMAMGASGAVMGTRFTVANESIYPEHRKQRVLDAKDGGEETFKSPFNDRINNNPLWGPLYDGRAIIGPIHEMFLEGASLEECQESLKNDYSPDEAVKIISTWAGTGVGLVRKAQPAGDIVREVRDEAWDAIRKLNSTWLTSKL